MGTTVEVQGSADWMYQLRTACQSLACRVLDADRADFEKALLLLCDEAPAPVTIQDADTLKLHLELSSIDAGAAYHQAYHRRTSQQACNGAPVEAALHVWREYHFDARESLKALDRGLPRGVRRDPSGIGRRAGGRDPARAARGSPDLDSLALEVGMSRSTLTLRFQQYFGMS